MEEKRVIDDFEKLKEMLSNAPILTTPIWLHVDASNIVVGAMLPQLDEKGHNHPMCYAGQQLISAKRNYVVIKEETLAIVFVVKTFRHLGNKFTIVTTKLSSIYFQSSIQLGGLHNGFCYFRNMSSQSRINQKRMTEMLTHYHELMRRWEIIQRMMIFWMQNCLH